MNKKLRVEVEVEVDKDSMNDVLTAIRAVLIQLQDISGVRLVEPKQFNSERGWLSFGWKTTIDTTEIWIPLHQYGGQKNVCKK